MLLSRSFLSAALAACVLAAFAGCGSGDDPAGLKGTNVTGPGVTDAQVNGPDVKPNPGTFPVEREHLAQRIRLLGLPPVGSEKFHQHALLNIYYDGLLVPLASGIGLDNKRKVFSSLHTHAQTTVPGTSVKPSPNVIHMESDKPFKATLGDFFAVWGVSFGPDQSAR